MTGKYYEDFQVGEKHTSPGKTVTDTHITLMVGLSGYNEPYFLDEEAAKKTMFGGRVAPGRMTVFLMGALAEQIGIFHDTAIAMVGLDKIKIKSPLRAGDTIRVVAEIVDKKETSRPDRGIVVHKETCLNQRDEVVAEVEVTHLIKRKP